MNEDNNIENTKDFKTIVVAQDGSGDYESIGEALFHCKDNENVIFRIKKGKYLERIVIDRSGKTDIRGERGVIITNVSEEKSIIDINNADLYLSNLLFIYTGNDCAIYGGNKTSKLTIESCCIYSDNASVTLLFPQIELLKVQNCIIEIQEGTGLICDSFQLFSFRNNTMLCNNQSIFLGNTKGEIGFVSIYENIFYKTNIILNNLVNQENKIKFKKNIFLKNKNNKETTLFSFYLEANLLQINLSFINEEKRDYRIEDPRYKDFGASDETILFFMNNEEEQTHKPKKIIKDFLIYIDTSQFKKDFEDFIIELKKESEIKNIIPIYSVEELKEQKDISTLVLVSPVDKSENENEIFEVLAEAKKLKKDIFIFLADIKKHTGDKMNIAKMPQVLETHTKLKEEENVSFYENTEQLEEIIYQRLQSSFPKVALEKLKIKNIGHFSELEIDFEESNQNAYCFIGTNGTGKTSILRAIILGLIGISSKALDKNELQNLVKIYGIEDENIKRENAFIELHYLVDNKKQHSKIVCEIGKDGTLDWKNEGSFALLDEPFLESLVIAFSQLRGERGNNGNSNKEISRQLRPHISDVLPLVYNEVDKRLSDFSRWIIDLYAKANEKELQIQRKTNKKEAEIIERTTINLVFEIISELLDQKIKFKEVRDNKEVWICTELAEKGIPITLVSQGFNTIIGWIGGLLQRMQEVYGLHALGRKEEFRTYPAFCVIDELDPHLHPKVQANLMNVLKKYFPNTLFVFSTHSPLIIPYLEKENVFMLTQDGQVSNAHIHTKGRSYQSILLDFMNVSERPKEYADKLDTLYRLIDDENIEEAKKKLAEIVKDFGENDPEILRVQTMIDFIEE